VTILVIDYFLAIYTKYGVPRLCILVKFFGRFILFAVVLFIGYKLLSQINWLSLIQSKFDFYWGEKELDSYPYLSGGFFYLVILPLSVDVFLYLRRKSSINPLCFVLLMVWFLICLTFMLPISHGLDRIITALLLLGYIKRLKMEGLRYEYIYTFIRLLALLYYIIVR
jgi:hypothetical protein